VTAGATSAPRKPQDEAAQRDRWPDELRRQKAAAEEVLERQRAWAASMQQQHVATQGSAQATRAPGQVELPPDGAMRYKAEAKTPERPRRWASKDSLASRDSGLQCDAWSEARPSSSRGAGRARSAWTPSRPEKKEWWADMRSPMGGATGSVADGLEQWNGEDVSVDGDLARKGRPLRRRGKISEYGLHASAESPPATPASQAAQHQPRTRRRGKFATQEEATAAEAARGRPGAAAGGWEDGSGSGWRPTKGAGKAASSSDAPQGSAAPRRRRHR